MHSFNTSNLTLAAWLFVAACVTSYVLGWPIRYLLGRLRVIDAPNKRSSHSSPVVRGGGLSIILTFSVIAGFMFVLEPPWKGTAYVFLGVFTVAAVSFWDDICPIPASIRFACHALAASLVLASFAWGGGLFDLMPWNPEPALQAVPLAVFFIWVVGYTNAFNFMDGINGIAAMQATVTGTGMALLGGLVLNDFSVTPVVLSLLVAGSSAGFVPHNFPRARMFMGDVGSASLGFLLAVLVVWLVTIGGIGLLPPLILLHANFLLDTGITLIRRYLRGERWYEPHRDHFYQRMVRSGRSHTFVAACEFVLQCITLGLLIRYINASTSGRIVLSSAIILIWLMLFTIIELLFRRASNPSGRRL